MRLITAHSGIEEVADGFEFLETFDDQFRTGRTGSRLDLDIGESEPPLDDSRAEMDVLDAGVGKINFAAEQDAHFHVNPLLIETIAESMIAEVQIRNGSNHPR